MNLNEYLKKLLECSNCGGKYPDLFPNLREGFSEDSEKGNRFCSPECQEEFESRENN